MCHESNSYFLFKHQTLSPILMQSLYKIYIGRFIVDNLLNSWNEIIDKDNNDEVQSYFFMGALIFDIILDILLADGLKAIGSLVAVFIYLRIMIGS